MGILRLSRGCGWITKDTSGVRKSFLVSIVSRSFSKIATRWAAGVGSPPEWSRNQAAFVLGQLTQVTEPQVEPRPQKRIQINRQLRPLFLYGHLTPLSRTLVSTRESIPFRV